MAEVPCNGCTACCENWGKYGGELSVENGDKPELFETLVDWRGIHRLAVKDGHCIYLEPKNGCTINDRKPYHCREFDCRELVKDIPAGLVVPEEIIDAAKLLEAEI